MTTDIPEKLTRAEAEERLRALPFMSEAHVGAVLDRARDPLFDPRRDTAIEKLPPENREGAVQVRAIVAAHVAYLAAMG